MLDLTKQLKKLEKLKNSLEKKEEILIISDFDDTLFCRKGQLKYLVYLEKIDEKNEMKLLWILFD